MPSTETLSYSRVDTWKQCPYRYALRYRRGVETLPTYDPADPLILGTAFHTAIEKGIEAAEEEYYSAYPILNDQHSYEMMKLGAVAPNAREILDAYAMGETPVFERAVYDRQYNWIGYVDCIIPRRDGTYAIVDFKYASSPERYAQSSQILVYKFFVERNLGVKVSDCVYLVAPKIKTSKKWDETEASYLRRLRPELESYDKAMMVRTVLNEERAVEDYLTACGMVREAKEFPKVPDYLCRWCEYKRFCESGEKDLTDIVL